MASVLWLGEASKVTQVDTGTISLTWAGTDTMTSTMTAEDGTTTQVVSTVVSSATLETCIDEHLSDLQGSSLSMFKAVAFTKGSTTTIVCTARAAGVPFNLTMTETMGGGRDGRWIRTSTTANAGPNDWGTAANWDGDSPGTLPASGDDVFFTTGSSSVLYGLNQSAINLNNLYVGKGYSGNIGDKTNGYYLQIDVSNGATPVLSISGQGTYHYFDGDLDTVYVLSGGHQSDDFVKLKGLIVDLWVTGSSVTGTVTVGPNVTIKNIYQLSSAQSRIIVDSTATMTASQTIEVTAGRLELYAAMSTGSTLSVAGGEALVDDATLGTGVKAVTVNQRGGRIDWRSGANITDYYGYTGVLDGTKSRGTSAVITNAYLYGSTVLTKAGTSGFSISTVQSRIGGDSTTDIA